MTIYDEMGAYGSLVHLREIVLSHYKRAMARLNRPCPQGGSLHLCLQYLLCSIYIEVYTPSFFSSSSLFSQHQLAFRLFNNKFDTFLSLPWC
jgi:hypothetical protein